MAGVVVCSTICSNQIQQQKTVFEMKKTAKESHRKSLLCKLEIANAIVEVLFCLRDATESGAHRMNNVNEISRRKCDETVWRFDWENKKV